MTWRPPPTQAEQPTAEEEYGSARPPDDDTRWHTNDVAGASGSTAQLARCEDRLRRVLRSERPQALLNAILQSGCSALLKSTDECVRCRICPSGGVFDNINAYYRGSKQRVYICAEKEPTEAQMERLLTHELVHAYDHCRYSMRVPFVGRQAPWALTCGAEACSEVRAYLLGDFWKPAAAFSSSFTLDPAAFDERSSADNDDRYAPPSLAASDSTPMEAASTHREAIYHGALASTSAYGTCKDGEPRRVLDAVFNACIEDYAPFTRDGCTTKDVSFPPMPSEVASADGNRR